MSDSDAGSMDLKMVVVDICVVVSDVVGMMLVVVVVVGLMA
jgi:hypothetical protein